MSTPDPLARSAVGTVLRATRGISAPEEEPIATALAPETSPVEPEASPVSRNRENALLIATQTAFNDYLKLKPALDSVESIESELDELEALMQEWLDEFGSEALAENLEKMELLQEKLALEIEAYESVQDHAALMDDLLQQLESAEDPEERTRLVGALQTLSETFPS